LGAYDGEDLLGANRGVGEVAVNRSGAYAWEGAGATTQGRLNIFRGQENLSARVFGSEPHEVELLGSGRFAYALGFAGESPLWYGYGSLQSGLFVGSLNLSVDAGIPNAPFPEAWATNELGDVLWLYKENVGGSYRYNLWLSTLVPEPSPMLVLPLLALAAPSLFRRR
jgi:hypothetical protein